MLVVQVKPQYLDSILDALKPHILPSHLVISIAAGIRVASLEAALPEGTRVVRSRQPVLKWELQPAADSASLHCLSPCATVPDWLRSRN